MVDRLRRLDWVFERSPIYFLTASTRDRRMILANSRVHERLISFAAVGPEHGAWMGAYVVMPDHLHVLVALNTTEGEVPVIDLSEWIKSLKNALSKILREDGVSAPHWQKGAFDHVLRSEESYAEKWEYIRQNPVRAGLVARVEDWPYKGQPFPLDFRSE